MLTQGQGALWGGLFAHSDLAERTAANVALKKKCAERGVLPLLLRARGSASCSRTRDLDMTTRQHAKASCPAGVDVSVPVEDFGPVLPLEVVDEMSWSTDDLCRLAKPAEVTITSTTTTTTSASEPIVQEALSELEAPCAHLSERDRAIVQLNTAYYHRCARAWSLAAKHARTASLEDEAIAALARGRRRRPSRRRLEMRPCTRPPLICCGIAGCLARSLCWGGGRRFIGTISRADSPHQR